MNYDNPKAKPKSDPLERKADSLAGEGSTADKLRKRRRAIESGDASGGREATEIRGEEAGAYDGLETP
jgi:hypothetical protein